MERINLPLLANQKLSETPMFKEGTPSNTIIFKKLCGIGATHGEAKIYKRHSIIIVPNTPVLKGKQEARDENGLRKYPNILTVYEGVTKEDISAYLAGDIKYKKILCTPEAYMAKVKPAFVEQDHFDLFTDFFMLLDECDKIITESDYRRALLKPIDDFFLFKNKAMISATAIVPSDKRFQEQGFKRIYIKPKFRFKQQVVLVETNNIVAAVQDEIEKHSTDCFFIFVNSADLIHAIITLLQIEQDSKVFCAETSKTKLKDSGLDNVYTNLGAYAKYNFLTSRFYNAVDIDLSVQPVLLFATDVLRNSYTMLDPYSDSVQIAGRFRCGVKSIHHISNFNSTLTWHKEKEALSFLKNGLKVYNGWIDQYQAATEEGEKAMLLPAIKSSFIHPLIKDGSNSLNTYLVDGFILDEQVKSYYHDSKRFHHAYKLSNYFRPSLESKFYTVCDRQLISLSLKATSSALIKNISEILDANNIPRNPETLQFNLGRSNDSIKKLYPAITDYYETLGFSKLQELEFNKSKIDTECKRKKSLESRFNPALVIDIQALYKVGEKPLESRIKLDLNIFYIKHNLKRSAKVSDIKLYYATSRSSNASGEKIMKIIKILQIP
ncbi:hypothetical protein GCM10011387_16000 [Pedobacter quisquiliarum]|uniref:Uncharacterized protein n=1 Tax=Pedobacter quisquiliarum TaxID=1834438 RepID=A0A916XCD6_9SPHI|nr:hypothetical protein [Pedobacter quisquiliarum]GGC63196.1 hypothetical protein GCM10011387_16000 [Pedobacter quisquiliarum]